MSYTWFIAITSAGTRSKDYRSNDVGYSSLHHALRHIYDRSTVYSKTAASHCNYIKTLYSLLYDLLSNKSTTNRSSGGWGLKRLVQEIQNKSKQTEFAPEANLSNDSFAPLWRFFSNETSRYFRRRIGSRWWHRHHRRSRIRCLQTSPSLKGTNNATTRPQWQHQSRSMCNCSARGVHRNDAYCYCHSVHPRPSNMTAEST